MVNLTHINDFMIAMTTFLKTDKSTRGVGQTGTDRAAVAGIIFHVLSNPENPENPLVSPQTLLELFNSVRPAY